MNLAGFELSHCLFCAEQNEIKGCIRCVKRESILGFAGGIPQSRYKFTNSA